jgi:hypothetical protein
MLPRDLKPENFIGYPPLAKKLVTVNLDVLRSLPLSMLPNLLREAIDFDFKFHPERRSIELEISALKSLPPESRTAWLGAFEDIQLSPALESMDWVNQPGLFVEQLSAHLWSTHQQDAFRKAAIDYGNRLHAAVPPEVPTMPRLGVSIIGQGVTSNTVPLFRKLRPHGTYYTNLNPENGVRQVLDYSAARAKRHNSPHLHWYIDGGQESAFDPMLTCVSYRALAPARAALLARMEKQRSQPGTGPEALRTTMSQLRPSDLGLENAADPILSRYQLKVLTEGSGTQIFATTFAQWAAREALRRAQPWTLVVRFAPRQRQRPMNELLLGERADAELDPDGSLVDGDMGAYYNWLNQQRLPGAEHSGFVAWFEGHKEAVAIGPGIPRGTVSNSATDLNQILKWAVS